MNDELLPAEAKASAEGPRPTETVNPCLTNSLSKFYKIIEIISQQGALLYYLFEGESEEKKRELVNTYWSIYSGPVNHRVIDYLLEHKAATVYTLQIKTGASKETLSQILTKLQSLGHVEQKPGITGILDKKLGKRGPKTHVWVLVGAAPECCDQAIMEHMRLKNPALIKRLEEEAVAERETKRQQREAELEAARRDEDLDVCYQSNLDKFLKTLTAKTVDYSEIDSYLATIKVTGEERRSLRYRFRDSLKDMGRWR